MSGVDRGQLTPSPSFGETAWTAPRVLAGETVSRATGGGDLRATSIAATRRWALVLASLAALAACGRRVSHDEAVLLSATVGASATELASSLRPGQLQAIAHDLSAPDAAARQLGYAECRLLQAQAAGLGREAAAIVPLVAEQPERIGRSAVELETVVNCDHLERFVPERIERRLREALLRIETLLPQPSPPRQPPPLQQR